MRPTGTRPGVPDMMRHVADHIRTQSPASTVAEESGAGAAAGAPAARDGAGQSGRGGPSGRSDGVAYPPPESWPTGRLLSAAARRVERAWDAYLEQWNLTHASVPVLVVLTRGPLSQREIA